MRATEAKSLSSAPMGVLAFSRAGTAGFPAATALPASLI
ncbi:hypothetical protein XHC_2057 [Xanthomonas hortorum pv. carotae str. M081]|nr:hypothetical protein XHC_2057 [Xanthomonas hortorum pv. carotae str. M081]